MTGDENVTLGLAGVGVRFTIWIQRGRVNQLKRFYFRFRINVKLPLLIAKNVPGRSEHAANLLAMTAIPNGIGTAALYR